MNSVEHEAVSSAVVEAVYAGGYVTIRGVDVVDEGGAWDSRRAALVKDSEQGLSEKALWGARDRSVRAMREARVCWLVLNDAGY